MPLPATLKTEARIANLERQLEEDLPRCETPPQIQEILATSRGDNSSDPRLRYLPQCCEYLIRIGSLHVAARRFDDARACFRRASLLWATAVSHFPFDFRDQVRVGLHSSRLKHYEGNPNYRIVHRVKGAVRGYYDVTLSYLRQPHTETTSAALFSALAAKEYQMAASLARAYKVYLPDASPNLLGVAISLLRGDDHLVQPYFATPNPVGKPSLQFPPRPREFAYGITQREGGNAPCRL